MPCNSSTTSRQTPKISPIRILLLLGLLGVIWVVSGCSPVPLGRFEVIRKRSVKPKAPLNHQDPVLPIVDIDSIESPSRTISLDLNFKKSIPASPTRISDRPYFQGMAGEDIVTVKLYTDSHCDNLLATGSLEDWRGSGIQIQARSNASTLVYGQGWGASDLKGPCTYLTTFTHDTVPPTVILSAPSQLQANSSTVIEYNVFFTEVILPQLSSRDIMLVTSGSAICNDVQVSGAGNLERKIILSACLGEGSVGISISPGLVTDTAGNPASHFDQSLSFIVDTVGPTLPTFQSIAPISPGDSSAPLISGTASTDTWRVSLFSQSNCTSGLGSGVKSDFEGTGIRANVGILSTTEIYAHASDTLGNNSPCVFLTSYTHQQALQIMPPSLVLNAAPQQSHPFSAIAGSGNYRFSVSSGSGNVDLNTGVYTSSRLTRGTSQVSVLDDRLYNSTATINHVPIRTNGSVSAAVTDGTSWYLGGSFTAVNPIYTPSIAVLDLTSGDISSNGCNYLSGFNGEVLAITNFGTDVVFVGGTFTQYFGAPALNLAKINLKTCTLDSGFTQATGFGFSVHALIISGSSLYIGGDFISYRGQPANHLAKIDIITGDLDTIFTQSTGMNTRVTSLDVFGTSLYVGGWFSSYRGIGANHLAKLNLTSGDLDTFFTQNTGMDFGVESVIASGSSLYVGGVFTTYRGQPANRLAKIDFITGDLDTTFTQATGMNYAVLGLSISGTFLYVGGIFSTYRGQPASYLAKVNLITGDLDTTFTQNTGANNIVKSLRTDGSFLYVGGFFTNYRGLAAERLAKVNLITGDLDTTFTHLTGLNAEVNTMSISNSLIYVGGRFTTYRGIAASYLAKIDGASGNLDSTFTQPNGLNGRVMTLSLVGSALYVGGHFTSYRGSSALYLAKLDSINGDLNTTFNQDIFGANSWVNVIAHSGTSLYLGGHFTTYRGLTAQRLAKVDLTSGDLDTTFTRPASGLNGDALAMSISGTSLYIGGGFSLYRGIEIQNLAKLDLSTGDLDPTFTQVNGPNSWVNSLSISGSFLYLGGWFTTYRGLPAPYVAKVDLSIGALDTSFTQAIGFDSAVSALCISGSSIYVGGYFSTYRNVWASALAKLDLNSGDLDTTFTQPIGILNGSSNSLTVLGSSLFLGGSFKSYRGFPALYWSSVDLNTGDLSD